MQQKRIQTLVNWPTSSSSSGILFLYVFSISISNKIVYFLCGSHTNSEKKESINMNGRQSGKKKKRILFKIERKKKIAVARITTDDDDDDECYTSLLTNV